MANGRAGMGAGDEWAHDEEREDIGRCRAGEAARRPRRERQGGRCGGSCPTRCPRAHTTHRARATPAPSLQRSPLAAGRQMHARAQDAQSAAARTLGAGLRAPVPPFAPAGDLSLPLISSNLGTGEGAPRVPNECRKDVRGVCGSRWPGDFDVGRAGERLTCPYLEGICARWRGSKARGWAVPVRTALESRLGSGRRPGDVEGGCGIYRRAGRRAEARRAAGEVAWRGCGRETRRERRVSADCPTCLGTAPQRTRHSRRARARARMHALSRQSRACLWRRGRARRAARAHPLRRAVMVHAALRHGAERRWRDGRAVRRRGCEPQR